MDFLLEQADCLEQVEGAGARFISMMDDMPAVIRERLRENPFNLCAACVVNHRSVIEDKAEEAGVEITWTDAYHRAIDQMNQKIRVADRVREIFGNTKDVDPDELSQMVRDAMETFLVDGRMPFGTLVAFDLEDLRQQEPSGAY